MGTSLFDSSSTPKGGTDGFSSRMGFIMVYPAVLNNVYSSSVSPCSNFISVVTAVKTNRQKGKNDNSLKLINKNQ